MAKSLPKKRKLELKLYILLLDCCTFTFLEGILPSSNTHLICFVLMISLLFTNVFFTTNIISSQLIFKQFFQLICSGVFCPTNALMHTNALETSSAQRMQSLQWTFWFYNSAHWVGLPWLLGNHWGITDAISYPWQHDHFIL